MAPQEDQLRFRVYSFYSKHIQFGKSFTVAHFEQEGESRRTIYNILTRQESGIGPERTPGSGRKPEIFTKRKVAQLQKLFDGSDQISTRVAAKKFQCSQRTICRVLADKTNIHYRKKSTIPDRTEAQQILAKTKCGRLMRKFPNHDFILDDESYFTFSHSTIHGNGGYYTSDPSSAPADVKFARKKKFEEKVLVWIALGPKGLSAPYIRKSPCAINQKIYWEQCIRRRLIPYIRANYQDGEYVFWPDKASCHYAKTVTEHLYEENVEFVKKEDNPANLPEARPIEDFWAILKGKVYKKGWRAESTKQLINRIKYCLGKMDSSLVQQLATSTRKKIDLVRRRGVVETRQ